MNLSFRSASKEDIPLIVKLADKIWREHYPSIISIEQVDFMLRNRYSSKAIEERMSSGEKYFIAFEKPFGHKTEQEAMQDPTGLIPVAYASVELLQTHYYMHKFYVDVASHRKGIGGKFFDFILTHIDLSVPLKLQVNRQNIKAVNFYFKKGFTIERAEDFDIGGGFFMNDFVMLRNG